MKKRKVQILIAGLALIASCCPAQVTNIYHFEREFVPVTYSNGTPTVYSIIMGADQLTGIVGPTNIIIISNQTFATEYEGFAWGYESHWAAWTSALSIHPQYFQIHSNVFYDNVGYIKGTREAYGTFGAYVWYLKNTIAFTSSASSVYIDSSGVTSPIASVLVSTIGDFCPQTVVTDVGPLLNTNYLGGGVSTDYVARADVNAYYKLVPFTYLGVNNDDSDGDGIPDFIDGYNRDSGISLDNISSNDFFTPWKLMLSGYADPTQAQIRITYSDSDPMSVSATTNGYIPASGYLRLWRKQAFQARSGTSFLSGGDYIPSGTFAVTSLGFSVSTHSVEVYLEPVNPGTNQFLLVEIDPDGDGPKGFVCIDHFITTPITVMMESSNAFAGVYEIHEGTEASPAPIQVMLNNPHNFVAGNNHPNNPCDGTTLAPQLVVFYDSVTNGTGGVLPFDVYMKILPTNILGTVWTSVQEPLSGSLSGSNSAVATFSDPTMGGVYQWDLKLGNSFITRVTLNLPFAGAEMLSWLDEETKDIQDWCSTHKEATISANYSPIPGLTRHRVYETWCSISGTFFDYIFDPVDSDALSPCRRFQPPIGSNGQYGYLTINGIVVHGSKINNMMWALFGRYWGYRKWELKLGAHANEIFEHHQLDRATSQNAIGLGVDIFNLIQNNPSASIDSVLTTTNLMSLQDSELLNEERMWPAISEYDSGQSQLLRPWLPTTP